MDGQRLVRFARNVHYPSYSRTNDMAADATADKGI